MPIRTAMILALVTLSPLAGGQAQIIKPLRFTILGGVALPTDKTADLVRSGYTAGGAIDLELAALPIGVRTEIGYTTFNAKSLSATGTNADATELGANANLVIWIPVPTAGLVRPYLTAGPGYSRLELLPTGGPGSTTVTRWGVNAGGGAQLSLGELGVRFDARFRRIDTQGDAFTYVAVTMGITF